MLSRVPGERENQLVIPALVGAPPMTEEQKGPEFIDCRIKPGFSWRRWMTCPCLRLPFNAPLHAPNGFPCSSKHITFQSTLDKAKEMMVTIPSKCWAYQTVQLHIDTLILRHFVSFWIGWVTHSGRETIPSLCGKHPPQTSQKLKRYSFQFKAVF